MTFASPDYIAFFALVFALYWQLPHRGQNLLLAGSSLFFYGWVHLWWVSLLLYSAVLDWSVGLAMVRWPARKQALLACSVIGNLGLLAGFKYHGFFVDDAAVVLGSLGLRIDPMSLQVALPVGLSFYTFQSFSYSADVFRGKQVPCRDPLTFLVFVSFFPQLVLGPIGRARKMIPQIEAERRLVGDAVSSGVTLALWGAFKKVVIADTLAGFVRATFDQPHASWAMVWTAGLGASVMMFADFSGYSDIARGCARLLGFELPINFRAPYLATTLPEWWTRWHITFYEWMGEYVFQPLVASSWCRRWLVPPFLRVTPTTHAVRGLVCTMLLSGLWHGAALNYVVWAAMLAVIQLVYFFAGRRMPSWARTWPWRAWVLRPLLLAVVIVSEVLFQVPDVNRSVHFLLQSPLGGTDAEWAQAWTMLALTLSASAPMVAVWWASERWMQYAPHPAAAVPRTMSWCALAWSVFVFYSPAESDFQYFGF